MKVASLPNLQNAIKRDPASYRDDFMTQWRHFDAHLQLFLLSPEQPHDDFLILVTFLSHVAPCYRDVCAEFPAKLVDLLNSYHNRMHPDARRSLVQALILLKNRKMMTATSILSLFFSLFKCHDKQLRTTLHTFIVNDIKNANNKSKNNQLNKTLQNFMFTMLNDANDIAAKKSLEVMMDLYRKNIWRDAKTVNIIATACLSSHSKLVATALNFFLGHDQKEDEDSDDEDAPDVNALQHTMHINKKKRSRKAQYEKALATIKRKERAKQSAESFNFSALHLLNDPQDFAEKLFSKLRSSTSSTGFRFELRLLMMNLISRMIGIHKLILFPFYDYMKMYLKPSQKDVTSMLAYVAQASHDMVPPDVLESIVESIANQFVWSNCANEVICAGLNTIREVCTRCPLAMPEALLHSMIDDYKKYKDKGVVMAAKSLLGLYRTVNPEILRKKDKGRMAVMMKDTKIQKYGETTVHDTIEGIELLAEDTEDEEDLEEIDEESSIVDNQEEDDVSDEENSEQEEEGEEEGSVQEEEGEFNWDDFEECSVSGEELEDIEEEEEVSEQDESEEEESPKKKQKSDKPIPKPTETILTDEDFAKIRARKLQKEAAMLSGIGLSRNQSKTEDDDVDEFVDPSQLLAGVKRKMTYEERMESIMAGREGREKYGSKKGKKERSSLTNKEKAKKNKNFKMIQHKRSVQSKAKRSLREKQKVLRAHAAKQKMKKK